MKMLQAVVPMCEFYCELCATVAQSYIAEFTAVHGSLNPWCCLIMILVVCCRSASAAAAATATDADTDPADCPKRPPDHSMTHNIRTANVQCDIGILSRHFHQTCCQIRNPYRDALGYVPT